MSYRGTIYGIGAPPRLHPRHVQNRQFRVTHIGRRGLDPREVQQFLHRVAHELAILNEELNRMADENARLKRALRDRQRHNDRWSQR